MKEAVHEQLDSRLRCFQCKKIFEDGKTDELEQHEELHKSNLLDPFACVMCESRDFTNSYDLSVHVSHEHEETLLKCEKCHKVRRKQAYGGSNRKIISIFETKIQKD